MLRVPAWQALPGAGRGGGLVAMAYAATGFAYLCDNTVGFLRAATVMHGTWAAGGSEASALRAPHAREDAVTSAEVLQFRLG